MTWLCRLLSSAVAMAALLFLLAAEAQAHAALVGSEPADGAVLTEAPDRLRLEFSEPVSPLVLRLVGPAGEPLSLSGFHLHGQTLAIELPGNLPDGSYALSWRVTSTDGHPIGGSVVFSAGAPGAAGPVPQAAASDGLAPFIWAARVALYIGLFFGVGALAFHAFIAPAPLAARRISLVLIGVGLLSVPPSTALHGLDLMGVPLRDIGRAEIWAAAFSSTYSWTLLVAATAMAVGLAAWLSPAGRMLRVLSATALAGVGVALAASGHASAASPQWLMRPAVFLHCVGVAAWAGSLLPFVLALRGDDDAARRMVARFSAAILPMVGALTLAGAVLAVVQVERLDALWTTAYGRVLLVKLGLVLALLSFAAINRLSLTPAFAGQDPGAARLFARSVRVEIVLVCAILAVVSLWRFTPPPRSLLAAEAAPVSVHIHSDEVMAELTIAPGRAGPGRASLQLATADAARLEPKEVTLSMSNPAAGIEPIRRAMTNDGEGRWIVKPLTLPVPGIWSVEIDVLVSDFEMTTLEGEIGILP